MEVHVFGEARARDLPFIDAHVKAVRFHYKAEGFERELSLGHQFGKGLSRELLDCFHMLVRGDHQVAIVVWVEVQHHEAVFAAIEDVVLFVAVLSWLSTKNTPLSLWCFGRNKSHAPGSP